MTSLENFCVFSNAKLSKSAIGKPLNVQHAGIPPPILFFLAHVLANGKGKSLKEEQRNLSFPKVML